MSHQLSPARPGKLVFLLLLSVSLSTACDQIPTTGRGDITLSVEPHDGPLTTTFDTLNGIVRVANAGVAPEWQLSPVVSIGPRSVTDEGSPDEFGSVASVTLGPDDAVYVADSWNREVRVFGLDGAHRHTFGRMGEGPGEFDGLYSLAWVDDRLLAMDPHLGRISEFSADGEWLGQRTTVRGLTGSAWNIRFYPVGDNSILAYGVRGDLVESVYVGHDSRGVTGDTVHALATPPGPAASVTCSFEGGRRLRFFRIPFGAKFVQHPGPGGVIYSATADIYRIAITRGGSDTLRVIERALPAEPVSDEEWAAQNTEFEEFRREQPDASCDMRALSRASSKPFIENIYVAPDGKLWVEVVRTAGNRLEFFDPEGRLLGSVPAPPLREQRVPMFHDDLLVTIRRDDLDLDHIDVWRLAGPNQ